MSPIRLLAALACFGILGLTLPPALASRDLLPSLGIAEPTGPEVLTPLARLAPTADLAPARYQESERRDLTAFGARADYIPDPAQGTLHRTASGVDWWGAGQAKGPARPVILLIHGTGRNGRSMVDMWHETAEANGLILVAPDFEGRAGWAEGAPDPRIMMAALDQAATLYPVDRDRIYMFGHSRGAIAAQVWANRHAGPWRAVAVHAGTLPAQLVQPVAKGVPIRHYLGTPDHIFPVPPARGSGMALAAAGHPFQLVALIGHDHWFYATGEAIAADAWAWMSKRGG